MWNLISPSRRVGSRDKLDDLPRLRTLAPQLALADFSLLLVAPLLCAPFLCCRLGFFAALSMSSHGLVEALALCISILQFFSSYFNIRPTIKHPESPSRTLYCRFVIRVLRVFSTAAILALKCTQSNPRAVTVITNTVTLIESIFEVVSALHHKLILLAQV